MLSEGEKLAVDRLAFCLQFTRSGLLAKIAAEFVAATVAGKPGGEAELKLLAYLGECREAVRRRGEFAEKTVTKEGLKP